jgi:hypothetical protein
MDSAPETPRPSGYPPYWEPGTQILWHYGLLDRPHHVTPLTVVRDDAEALVAWLPAGTPLLRVARRDGLGRSEDRAHMFTADRVWAPGTWEQYDVLRIAPTGVPWSCWAFYELGSRAFAGWYVNLEDVHTRDDRAVYSYDRILDLWIDPDGSHGRKDEDELVLAVEQGRYTQPEADAITATAADAEVVIADWGPPYCDAWETFRPDPAWPVPQLPSDLIT